MASYINRISGIKMPPSKMTMLEGRLRRRLRATGYATLDDYCDFLFDEDGLHSEAVHLIDAVTTNKTDFFREPAHFDYLRDTILPSMAASGHRSIRIWSAACSTGAEPYTIAMLLEEFAEEHSFAYKILATDLSTEVLATAHRGVYSLETVAPVPNEFSRKYVMQSARPGAREVRIHPKLRSKVGFARMNLMDEKYRVGDPMDLIFCRNVLIYFDKSMQAAVLSRLCDCLLPGGYLFIGHSESLTGFDLPVTQVANTIFQKT
ncbi:CheR family methyltransferase [Hyphomicrobium sp. ghe19]|uniref:CheR family methyltransferase n=1 Tax=Hyphomicrobium sp. ghe19 TaxID=2682968 RepID=UPI0030CB0E63